MNGYTPQSDKAEVHLTYRCELSCACCNRACFLPPQTPDMTLADAHEFCQQARALDWRPRIMLIGGEPTLHPNFFAFLDVAVDFTGDPRRVEVWSNGYSDRAKEILARVREENLAVVMEGTIKTASVRHPVQDIFLAPRDLGRGRDPCGTHARCADPDCGISVDAGGYTLCCMGGAIDGILRLGLRTRRLADLWDETFAARQSRELCQYCGQHLGAVVSAGDLKMVRGTVMSRTWQQAAARILGEGKEEKGEGRGERGEGREEGGERC